MRARLAKLLRGLVAYAWDNPSAEQDARTILSSPKIGLWLGLEALSISLAAAIAMFVLPGEEDEVRELIVSVGVGPWLIFITLGVVTLFLTLVVPLRAVGLLEGPRWRGYLDQVVTTGITPLRYHAGKWATSQPFFLALLLASLPFVMLFGLLGGATLGRTAVAYLVLYAYANLLLLVTMGSAVLFHEVVALLNTWATFAALMLVDLFPVPSSLACFTPIRFLIQPVVHALAGVKAPVADRLYGAPHPFGLELPWPVWAFAVWGVVAAIVAITLLLGPLHGFPPGLNNFGTVVLPGDRRRAFFRRLRPFTTRRVELAFLFENRGARLVRLTLPLRCLQQVALCGLAALLLLSVAFDGDVVRELRQLEPILVLEQVLSGLPLVLALFLLRGGWSTAMTRFPVGAARVPVLLFDAAAFFMIAGLVILLHACGFATAWADLAQAARPSGWGQSWWETPEQVFATSSNLLNTQVVTALLGFTFMKVVGTKVLSEDQTFGASQAFIALMVALPLVGVGLASALARQDELPFLRPFAGTAMFVGLSSPAAHMLITLEGLPSELRALRGSWLLQNGFWVWQVVGLLGLTGYLVAGHRSLSKEADLLERAGDPEGSPPPEPGVRPCACGCALSVPAGWTPWGGVVAPWLMGLRRCLDCKTEFLRATGRQPGFAAVGVMLVRGVVATLLVLAFLAAAHLTLGTGP